MTKISKGNGITRILVFRQIKNGKVVGGGRKSYHTNYRGKFIFHTILCNNNTYNNGTVTGEE